MDKTRIAYLLDFLRTDRAGTEKQLFYLINGLDKTRYEIALISLQRSPFLEELSIKQTEYAVYILDGESDISRSVPALYRLYRLLRALKPHLVHTYFPASNSVGVIISKMAGVKHIISSRRDMGFNQTRINLLMTKIANRFVNRIIVNAWAIKEYVTKTEGFPDSKIDVVYNGIDLIPYKKNTKITIKDLKNIVLIIANLNRHVKRVDLFIRSAALVLEKHPDTQFWILGEGCLRSDLEALARELSTNHNIIFWGRQENVGKFLSQSNIGVICSDSEGFSNAIMEYMLHGLPVIATETGGNSELVHHQRNGILISTNDAIKLSEAILFLVNNPEEAVKMGQEGRDFIGKHFDYRLMIDKTTRIYNNLLNID